LRAVIFANGEMKQNTLIRDYLMPDDTIIAADGGTQHCLDFGVIPTIVIGDMDSINDDQKIALEKGNTKFIIYPQDKDQTDLELAFEHAKYLGVSEVLLFGLFGGRLDQTIANTLLLAKEEWDEFRMTAIDGHEIASLVRSAGSLSVSGQIGDIVSLIPLSQEVVVSKTENLRWPLKDATLSFGTTLGVSNEMVEDTFYIHVKSGKLLVVHTKYK
jgi:thiamine pyrophosphokinase